MASQKQDAAAREFFSKLRDIPANMSQLDKLMVESYDRCDLLMTEWDEMVDKSCDDPERLPKLAHDLRIFFEDGLIRITNIEKYQLVVKGTANVNGDTVTFHGGTMEWNAFCDVRNKHATISPDADVIELEGKDIPLATYMAARAAHRGIPEPTQ